MKRLGIIMLIGTTFLIAWAFRRGESPRQEVRYDPMGLKYETCTVTEWNFVSMASKLQFKFMRLNIYDLLNKLFFHSSIRYFIMGCSIIHSS